jgi:hypothetical protein
MLLEPDPLQRLGVPLEAEAALALLELGYPAPNKWGDGNRVMAILDTETGRIVDQYGNALSA